MVYLGVNCMLFFKNFGLLYILLKINVFYRIVKNVIFLVDECIFNYLFVYIFILCMYIVYLYFNMLYLYFFCL